MKIKTTWKSKYNLKTFTKLNQLLWKHLPNSIELNPLKPEVHFFQFLEISYTRVTNMECYEITINSNPNIYEKVIKWQRKK